MLKQIYVRNFILLDEVRLDFDAAMSAFTGETGAGKSLLMDAIGVLKGDRISADMVKTGCDKAFIEGVFTVPPQHIAMRRLTEQGFSMEDGLLIVSREITADGKSMARINQRMTTVSFLKEIVSSLVDIHSQHDTQYLLNARYHQALLDNFLDDAPLCQACAQAYHDYKSIADHLAQVLQETYNEDDLDFLTYQLQEIEAADIQAGELEEIEQRLRQLQAYEKTKAALDACEQLLDGEGGSKEQLYEAARALSDLQEEAFFATQHERLMDVYYELEDISSSLHAHGEQMEYDEGLLQQLQERSFLIHKLQRKYGGSYESIVEKQQALAEHIDAILHRQEFLAKQEAQKQAAWDAYAQCALQLRQQRQTAAAKLEKLVVAQLRELQLPHARFHIHIGDGTASAAGMDHIEFLISMNRGEPLKPLHKSASGGELSRFMLGMKCIFTRLQGIETVIFDEIDTGVSGSVAFSIGKKMQELGRQVQVFCVTHLAAVAACADQHYLVEKLQQADRSQTIITPLNESDRITHLAKIASNSTSPSALQAAGELLAQARK